MGKKAFTTDSELVSYSLFDNKESFDNLINLPCFTSRNKQKQQTSKKCRRSNNGSTNNQYYLNLPEDMVEDNPLDIENIKEKQDEDNNLQQFAIRHPGRYSRKIFMHNVGYHIIRGHKYVYMILGQNSQDQNFRHY